MAGLKSSTICVCVCVGGAISSSSSRQDGGGVTLLMKLSCFARGVIELLLVSKASVPVVSKYGPIS